MKRCIIVALQKDVLLKAFKEFILHLYLVHDEYTVILDLAYQEFLHVVNSKVFVSRLIDINYLKEKAKDIQ